MVGYIMKRILMSILAVLLPWLVLLIRDNPGGSFIALILQATVIGWPFAAIWAWRLVNPIKGSHKEQNNE